MGGDLWLPVRWVPPRKHRPTPGHIQWAEIVKRTAEGDQVSKYRPGLTRAQIEQIEMLPFSTDEWEEWLYSEFGGSLYASNKVQRYYLRDVTQNILNVEYPVGASCGEEVDCIVIQRHQDGSVHGYPEKWEIIEKTLAKHQKGS